MVGKRIFLSYSSKDYEFALKFARDIRQRGIFLWMDKLDGIRVGDDWMLVLERALNDAIGLVAVLSPNYVQSKFCRAELNRIAGFNRPIFPVLIEPVPHTDIPLLLQTIHYIDFTNWRDPQIYQQQLDNFVGVLIDKLQLTPNTPVHSEILPSDQSIAFARRLEMRIDAARQLTPAQQRRMEFIRQQLKILEEQYDAVMNAILVEVNPATRVLLNKQLEKIDVEMSKLEAELK